SGRIANPCFDSRELSEDCSKRLSQLAVSTQPRPTPDSVLVRNSGVPNAHHVGSSNLLVQRKNALIQPAMESAGAQHPSPSLHSILIWSTARADYLFRR